MADSGVPVHASSATTLAIAACGTLTLALHTPPDEGAHAAPDTPLTLPRRAEALIVYVACHPDTAVRRAHLASVLWPESRDEQALANLRAMLTRIRPSIAPFLQADRETLTLRHYTCDVRTLRHALPVPERIIPPQSHPATTLSPTLTAQAATASEAALALYRGPFLDGFALTEPPSALWEEWVEEMRHHMHTRVGDALITLAAYHTRWAEYPQALGLLTRLLDLDPLHEEANRQMVFVLALQGQRSAALDQYLRYHTLLSRELDIAPDAAITDLYERIRDGRINAEIPPPAAPPPGVYALPAKVTLLQRVSLFTQTPEATLVELAHALDDVHIPAGQTIFTEGEMGDCMYIVVEGQLRVSHGDRTLNFLSRWDIFGEMAVLDAAPRLASVSAITPAHLWRLDQATLYHLMARRVEVMRGIITVLTRRLRDRVQDIARLDRQMAQRDAARRASLPETAPPDSPL